MPSSTWKNRNIFEDVLNRENALTDALRNFLKYPPVRDALWQTLPKTIQESVDFSLLEDTQTRSSSGHSEGIPDLVLYGPDFILVIEVKIGAKLQPAQQKAYIPWIKKEIQAFQMGFIVFLIPDDYSHRVQLDSCLKKAKRELCGSNKSNIQILNPITWQTFVTELKSQDMPSLNELTREFYDYLYEKFEPVIFSTEEVRLMHSKETASGIPKLMDIVDKVNANFKNSSEFNGEKEITEDHDYGYHFSSQEKNRTVYFGIWWKFWFKKGFPLCLCIGISKDDNPQAMLEAFQKKYKDRVMPFNTANKEILVVGLCLDPDKNCSALIETIVKDIEDLLQDAP